MVGDLFAPSGGLETIPIPGGELYFMRKLPLWAPDHEILESLIAGVPWRSEKIVVWGKTYVQPRLIAWYGDNGTSYKYSGVRFDPLPWTDVLLRMKVAAEEVASTCFNSVLLNYYRTNADSMGLHADDEPELGPEPTIGSLSFGEERTFVLKHKTDKGLKPVRLKLGSGSFLLMKGDTQRNWKHGIEKESRACGPRVNLTFRRILNPSRRV